MLDLAGRLDVYHRLAVAADGPSVLISQPPGALDPGQGGGGGGGGLAGQLRQTADGANDQATGPAVTVVLNWPQMLEER